MGLIPFGEEEQDEDESDTICVGKRRSPAKRSKSESPSEGAQLHTAHVGYQEGSSIHL